MNTLYFKDGILLSSKDVLIRQESISSSLDIINDEINQLEHFKYKTIKAMETV